jgi:hypothetical protein
MEEAINLALNTDGYDFVGSNLSDEDEKAFAEFGFARVSGRITTAAFVLSMSFLTYFMTLSLIRGPPNFLIFMYPCLIFTFGFRLPAIIYLFWL